MPPTNCIRPGGPKQEIHAPARVCDERAEEESSWEASTDKKAHYDQGAEGFEANMGKTPKPD